MTYLQFKIRLAFFILIVFISGDAYNQIEIEYKPPLKEKKSSSFKVTNFTKDSIYYISTAYNTLLCITGERVLIEDEVVDIEPLVFDHLDLTVQSIPPDTAKELFFRNQHSYKGSTITFIYSFRKKMWPRKYKPLFSN